MVNSIRVLIVAAIAATMGSLSGSVLQAAPLLTASFVAPTVPLTAIPETDIATDPVNPGVAALVQPGTSLVSLVHAHGRSTPGSSEENCLATAVYFESKGEPLDGQLAVARVIVNRVASGRFAASVCGVIKQRGQFSFVRAGAMPTIGRAIPGWATAVGIAHVALNALWQPTAADALFFHAKRVAPAWGMVRVASIGNHIFYR